MQIDKKTAAIAQIETAIRLYFEDQDPISVHTLAHASGEILDGLCRDQGYSSMWSEFMSRIKLEKRKEMSDNFRKHFVFFKHGSNSAGVVNFDDDQNMFYLLRAVSNLFILGIENNIAEIFWKWLVAVEPSFFIFNNDLDIEMLTPDFIRQLPRSKQKLLGKAMVDVILS